MRQAPRRGAGSWPPRPRGNARATRWRQRAARPSPSSGRWWKQDATERELQIIIEACLDIGHHVLSREGLRRPGEYREVFAILREAGIIDAELGRRLEDMASFRKRLVHGYLQVDASRVYAVARNELGDVEAFVATIVRRYAGT